MLSRGGEYHLAPGSQLTLDCEFYMEAFDAFHNPVIWVKSPSIWVKSQATPAEGGAQRIKINVMAIIQPPFVDDDDDRFDVSLIKQPPRYELLLTVKGINLLPYSVPCIVHFADTSSTTPCLLGLYVLLMNNIQQCSQRVSFKHTRTHTRPIVSSYRYCLLIT